MTITKQYRYEAWAATLLYLTFIISVVADYILSRGYFAPHKSTKEYVMLYAIMPSLLWIYKQIHKGIRWAKILFLFLYVFVLVYLIKSGLVSISHGKPLEFANLIIQHWAQIMACLLLLLSLQKPTNLKTDNSNKDQKKGYLKIDESLSLMGKSTFKILSIDGGGIKGLYSATILAELEKAYGCRLCDYFDMICGTSTGGLIALGLSLGKPASELVELYEKQGPIIFDSSNPFKRLLGTLEQAMFGGKYANFRLKEAIKGLVEESQMSDSNTLLCIPTFNLMTGIPRVFKYPHKEGGYSADKYGSMADVALATTAAPTYFPIVSIENEFYVDGGVWANNPTLCGLQDALEYFIGPEKLGGINEGKVFDDYAILSVGSVQEHNAWSTKGMFSFSKSRKRSFLFGWRDKLFQTSLDAQSYSVDRLLKVLKHSTKSKGIYHRIESPSLSPDQQGIVGLDKANIHSINQLKALGRKVGQDYTAANSEHRKEIDSFFTYPKQYLTR